MAVVTARYMGFISDNHQGASGKPFEDSVSFEIDEYKDIYTLFGRVDMEIKNKTKKVAALSMCSNDEQYALLNIEITE